MNKHFESISLNHNPVSNTNNESSRLLLGNVVLSTVVCWLQSSLHSVFIQYIWGNWSSENSKEMDGDSSPRSTFKGGLCPSFWECLWQPVFSCRPCRADLSYSKLSPKVTSLPGCSYLSMTEGGVSRSNIICRNILTTEILSRVTEAIRYTGMLNFSSAHSAFFPSPSQLFIPWCSLTNTSTLTSVSEAAFWTSQPVVADF